MYHMMTDDRQNKQTNKQAKLKTLGPLLLLLLLYTDLVLIYPQSRQVSRKTCFATKNLSKRSLWGLLEQNFVHSPLNTVLCFSQSVFCKMCMDVHHALRAAVGVARNAD